MNSAVLAHWSSHFKELTSIDLLGPFNVHAEAWVSFISELRRPLEKFAVTQSPRLDMRCLQILQQRCGKSLKVLRLKEITKLDDEWLEVIKGFQNLTSLDISRPHQSVSDGALISLLSSGVGARLKHLDVSGHEELTDRSLLRGIGAFCAQLVSFAAADLALLSDEGVAMFFGGPKPEPLNDINPPSPTLGEEANDIEMTDGEVVPAENGMDAPVEPEGQPAIDEGPIPSSVLRPLESLDLSRCPCVGTLALSAMLAPPERADGRMGQSLLQTLNINQWKSCTNDALLAIGPALPNLRKINLGWCRNVDNFVMKALLDGCPKLNEILVSGCDLLDSNCPRRVSRSL
jgi:DNA repair protein RAD7